MQQKLILGSFFQHQNLNNVYFVYETHSFLKTSKADKHTLCNQALICSLWAFRYGVEKAGLAFDINARSTCGHTPLHIAAIHGHKNIMRLLVSKFKANVKLRDTAGKKPWQYLSCTASSDVFQLLGAPSRAAWREEGGVGRIENGLKSEQHQRRRRRHHFSSASGERPLTISGTTRVKRSSSIAAFLKHKSLRRFQGHQSDSSI